MSEKGNGQLNQEQIVKAAATLQAHVGIPVFLTKLAELGFAPQNEKEAQFLVQLGDKIAAEYEDELESRITGEKNENRFAKLAQEIGFGEEGSNSQMPPVEEVAAAFLGSDEELWKAARLLSSVN